MSNFTDLEDRFAKLLGGKTSPVAISFSATAPTGIRKFMGQVPSGCSFWRLAASAPRGKSAFVTAPQDHYNCPIGSYTHHMDLPKERHSELEGVLKFMVDLGYLSMEEVPQIPRWQAAGQFVTYSRLSDANATPDAVIFSLPAKGAMILSEAAHLAKVHSGNGAMMRPTCMAVPAAVASGTTTSLGCIGNRVYTELDDGNMYAVVRGRDLETVLGALERITDANAQLFSYHTQRKAELNRPTA
jgi:uncharacterized protein (DUF169 family)